MKKNNLIIVVLILLIGTITGIQFVFFNSSNSEILKKLDMQYQETKDAKTLIVVQNKLHNIEENISKLDLQLNIRIDELLIKTMDQSISIAGLNKVIGSKGIPEVKEIKDLLIIYIEEVEKDLAAKRLIASRKTVELDFLIQTLLDQGFSKYSNKDFTEAVKIYKEVLDIDSKNKEALCYFYASLYYQNPGDSTHYSDIKNNLSFILESDVLAKEEELTVSNILKGISLEEGK